MHSNRHSDRQRASERSKELIRELIKLNSSKAKKQSSSNSERTEKWFPILCGGWIALSTSMGIGLLAFGLSNYQAAEDFEKTAVSTTGVVTDTQWKSRTAGGAPIPQTYTVNVSTVRFETNQGKVIEFEADDICYKEPSRPDSCNGKAVQVLYTPDNPQLLMVEGGSSPLDKAKSRIGWGVFLILSGIVSSIFALTEHRGQLSLRGTAKRSTPVQRV